MLICHVVLERCGAAHSNVVMTDMYMPEEMVWLDANIIGEDEERMCFA